MSESFAEIVDSLEDVGQKGIFIQRRDSRIGVLDVFAARKIESGLEALLVRAQPTLLPRIEEWPQSEGFHVEIRPSEGKPGAALVCLELSALEFRDVFLSLAEDICSVLRQEGEPNEAVRAMLRRLFRWQEFLRKHRADGLSVEERVGLYGELEILRSIFLGNLDAVQAVKGWRGCKKASQDFQYPDLALEVKTTRAIIPDRMNISSIRQLDEMGINYMFLSLVCVDLNESVGASLPKTVALLRGLLPEPALSLFNEGLIEVGYLDIHESLYQNELYQVQEIMNFTVGEGFPRMRRSQVPDGVKAVKYQISVDACRPFLIENEALIEVVQKIKDKEQDD